MDLGLDCSVIFSCHDLMNWAAGRFSAIDVIGDPWEMKNVSMEL